MTQVRIGQVWEHCDKRMNGKRFEITAVDNKFAYYYLREGSKPQIKMIQLERMRPTANGYRLVSE